MKYIKKFNENTSSTGGISYGGETGNVSNMPNSMTTSMGPNSIGNNIGGIIDNTENEEEQEYIEEIEEDEIEEDESDRQKKSDKIRRQIEEEENQAELKEAPIMNWDTYIKQNINKINI